MGANFSHLTQRGRATLAIFAAAAIAWPMFTQPAAARGPDGIADVAEAVIDSVVNVSTKQTVDMGSGAMPQLPPGSPFEEFFEEFFKNKRGQGGGNGDARIRGGSIRSAPASSSIRPASSSPTTTSSPTPTRSTSFSTTAPRSRPS